MYILYANIAGWSKIDWSWDKKDIVDKMIGYSDKKKQYYFMVVDDGDKVRPPVTDTIRSEEEFKEYLKAYKAQLLKEEEDMSCVELKRYILDKQKNL